MNFPQFWARGRSGNFFVWRWSFESLAQAQASADEAARQIAERFRKLGRLPKHGGYYPDRPFREQILRKLTNDAGDTIAVITRNSYGCLVLNTAQVMFVDIDFPEPKSDHGFFKRLFRKPDPAVQTSAQGEAIKRVETWTSANAEWGWRIYRTRSGLRLLATQGLFEATSPLVNNVFNALGADPLYRKLCNTQNCFRARLTPKPWRCGIRDKPERWPFLEAKQEKQFEEWDQKYQARAADWATCELIKQIGSPNVHPDNLWPRSRRMYCF